MTADEFRFIKYVNANTSRFSFWLVFQNTVLTTSSKHRKDIIKFFTPILGPLGDKWQYERNFITFCLKLDNEVDAMMMVLRYQKN